ncbi:MAG TPA: glycoside hydrolase, partial [Cryomorphaceae bacterium]|nr:glycoside hydrolase [Cryomorphaceae bacterium]
MNKLIPFFLSIVLAFSSCTQEEKEPNVALPTALEYDIEVSKSTEGLVNVTVSAILANYYTVSFFEDEEPAVVEIKEGEEASYQFKSSGTYAVRIRAHATYQHFIEEEDSVTVEVKDTGNNGNNGELPKTGYTTPLSYNGYNLVWQDDFNGNSLSTTDWNYEIGTGSNGWGNNELQYYRKENTEVKDGYLIITAKKENFGGREYTSSRLTTQGKQSFKYGRIDIRAALPYGQGIWPALWMLGSSHSSVGWPRCGEIDIMEMVGGNVPGGGESRVHGTVHWDNNGS